MAKLKLQITSDGTASGTKFKLNGEDITEKNSVTNLFFSANGGIRFSDGTNFKPSVRFDYTTVGKDENQIEQLNHFSFDPDCGGFSSPTRGPIGKVEKLNDCLVGKTDPVIEEILSYKDKTKRFIPERDVLENRSIH